MTNRLTATNRLIAAMLVMPPPLPTSHSLLYIVTSTDRIEGRAVQHVDSSVVNSKYIRQALPDTA